VGHGATNVTQKTAGFGRCFSLGWQSPEFQSERLHWPRGANRESPQTDIRCVLTKPHIHVNAGRRGGFAKVFHAAFGAARPRPAGIVELPPEMDVSN
jgi:hypothetical protein